MHKLYSKFNITNSQNTKKIKTNKIKINVIKWPNIYGGSFEFDGSRKKKKIQIWSNLQLKIKLQPNPQKLVQGVIHWIFIGIHWIFNSKSKQT